MSKNRKTAVDVLLTFSRKTANDHRGLNVFSRVGIAEDQEYLLENLSMLVESGMDIPETLNRLLQKCEHRK